MGPATPSICQRPMPSASSTLTTVEPPLWLVIRADLVSHDVSNRIA
jgi:hypothetical protein